MCNFYCESSLLEVDPGQTYEKNMKSPIQGFDTKRYLNFEVIDRFCSKSHLYTTAVVQSLNKEKTIGH